MSGVISRKHWANHVILEMPKRMIFETFMHYNNSNFTCLDESADSNVVSAGQIHKTRSGSPIVRWLK